MDANKYEKQLREFISQNTQMRPEFINYYKQPMLQDDTVTTGFDTHYIYHVAWAIAKINSNPPIKHIDFASSLHFSTAICSILPTTFVDYRPAMLHLNNLNCVAGDLTNESQWIEKKYPSVSCMHVVEHIGLGRYGDNLDVNGDVKAMTSLKNMVSLNGRLLFVVPVGKPSIYFNAHRVYSSRWIADFFKDKFSLKEFYFIPGPVEQKPITNCDFLYTENYSYGCGCFEFVKHS